MTLDVLLLDVTLHRLQLLAFNACATVENLAKGHHSVAKTLARMLEVRYVQRRSIKAQHIKGHHVREEQYLDPSRPWGHADVL